MPIVDIEKNSAPKFTHNHNFVAKVGENYEIILTAEDQDTDELLFRSSLLPNWLKITDRTPSSMTLSGVPQQEDLGVNFFSAVVTDSKLSTDEHYAVLVEEQANSNAQDSPFSVFGKGLAALKLRRLEGIEVSGTEQPYSSVDISFDSSSITGKPLAGSFSLSFLEQIADGLTVTYTTISEYVGQISIKTDSLLVSATNTLQLSDGTETVQLMLSVTTQVSAFNPDEIITASNAQAETFTFQKDVNDNKKTLIDNFNSDEDNMVFLGFDDDEIVKTLASDGGDYFIFVQDNETIGEVKLSPNIQSSSLSVNNVTDGSITLSGETDTIVNISNNGELSLFDQTSFSAVTVNGLNNLKNQISKIGDSTASDPINLSDVLAQLKHIIGLRELKENALQAGDTNNDGEVNLSDVLDNLKHIIGLREIDTFDLVTDNGFAINALDADSKGNLTLVINGDADQSHHDWDFV